MCGRFSLSQSVEAIALSFELTEVPTLEPRYNIAPTQPVPVVLLREQTRQLRLLRWGLIPAWAKDPAIGAKLINARAETVSEKPSFRSAMRQRRCLVLADGFYEWQRQEGRKQPFYCRLSKGQPFAFAGLWEHWQGQDHEMIDSCTLLTTQANELIRPIHDRMPVILESKDYGLWLNPAVQVTELLPLLRPYPSAEMTAYPVGTQVNNPKNNTPECTRSL